MCHPKWLSLSRSKRVPSRAKPGTWRLMKARLTPDPEMDWRRDNQRFPGNRRHLAVLFESLELRNAEIWNRWRKSVRRPDLRGLKLFGSNLRSHDLRNTNLDAARLSGSNLWNVRLQGASLRRADLSYSTLQYGLLQDTDLREASLVFATMGQVNLDRAKLQRADLRGANLNGAILEGADLSGAHLSGTSSVGIKLDERTQQRDMRLYAWGDPLEDIGEPPSPQRPHILVQDLEAAYFIHTIAAREHIDEVLAAAADRTVLLLGRFTPKRMRVLESMHARLLDLGYAPVMNDFTQPAGRDTIEVVSVLAGLSRFVIADLTHSKSVPLESHVIIPNIMSPFASIVEGTDAGFSMFPALQRKYPWVMPTVSYRDVDQLVKRLETGIVQPAEALREQLLRSRRRKENLQIRRLARSETHKKR
jgi:uncharacterized protein YjbI with pentapeptide repeats